MILIIIAGNGARQCIIINYFSLPGSISSYNSFFDPRGLLEAEGRPAKSYVQSLVAKDGSVRKSHEKYIKITSKSIKKWSAFGLQEAPGGFPRAESEKKLLEMEPDKFLNVF